MSSSGNSEKDVEMVAPLVAKKSEEEPQSVKQTVEETKSVDYRKAFNSSMLYCFCSVSMVLANKSLASRYACCFDAGNDRFVIYVPSNLPSHLLIL